MHKHVRTKRRTHGRCWKLGRPTTIHLLHIARALSLSLSRLLMLLLFFLRKKFFCQRHTYSVVSNVLDNTVAWNQRLLWLHLNTSTTSTERYSIWKFLLITFLNVFERFIRVHFFSKFFHWKALTFFFSPKYHFIEFSDKIKKCAFSKIVQVSTVLDFKFWRFEHFGVFNFYLSAKKKRNIFALTKRNEWEAAFLYASQQHSTIIFQYSKY